MGWWIGVSLGLLLCTVSLSYPEDRRGSPFPADEHWQGSRPWNPERDPRWRGQDLPDRIVIEKPGKCEVRCERIGPQYKCREYRC